MRRVYVVLELLVSLTVVVALLAMFTSFFCLATKDVEKDKVGDLATWIGGTATVLTLAWAVWLSTRDQRKRERAEYDLAFVRWIELRPKVKNAHAVLDSIRLELIRACHERQLGDLMAQRNKLKDLKFWRADEVAPLFSLKDHVGIRLVSVVVHVDETLEMLNIEIDVLKKGSSNGQDISERYAELVNRIHRPFFTAASELEIAWQSLVNLRARGFGTPFD